MSFTRNSISIFFFWYLFFSIKLKKYLMKLNSYFFLGFFLLISMIIPSKAISQSVIAVNFLKKYKIIIKFYYKIQGKRHFY